MKSKIVKIGNSQGVRLPKALIKQTGIGENIEITMDGNRIVIASTVHPRANWAASFEKMSEKGDDNMLDGNVNIPTMWDEGEWEWQ
ncbi:AbrB/MazE/SpoVT family DNA-binding domain-containing protein [Candidatus Hydrogenedentota bacterium]